MKTLLILPLLLLGSLPRSHASEMDWPQHAEPIFAQANKSIPYAREFRKLYPDATMGFFMTGAPDQFCVSLTTGLFQHYLVSMDIPIKLTADRRAIASWKEPSLEVTDVGEIKIADDDQGYTTEGGWTKKMAYDQFLVKIHEGREVWQLNLLKTAQQALLRRTKAAAPKKYLAAKKANAGNGSAFPDGFTVNVFTDGEDGKTVALPLRVHVDLTADPKIMYGYPGILESHLDAVVTKKGKFVIERFHLGPRKS